MAGLREGGNEPPGSLNVNKSLHIQLYITVYSVVDFLSTEISTSKQKKFSLVTFVDTPGLVDGDMQYPFDVNEAILWLGKMADLIFTFFDPIGQALCKRTLNLVEKLNSAHAEKMRFYLSKADDAGNESDRQRSRLVPVAWQQWSEMEALIPSPAACEVRSVIKFFNAQTIAPIEIHRHLCQVYGPNIMSKQMVRRWYRQFSEGRQSVHDEERSGRPSLINDDHVEVVRQCIMENRHFMITELSSHFPQISRSLLHEIVAKHLLFKKVCARWVPKNLTPEHKMQRLGAALTFLQWYHDDGDEFLDRIVMGDETWISHFTPETKQQSMHWRHSGSPVGTKFKQTLSVRKVMCTMFWDRKGILLIDFLPRGEKVNADRYCETLRKLRCAIQNKRRGMLTAGVVLLHDNARPHTAWRTAAVLTEFGWVLFDHPPYSPDLAPSDFHVFLHLKKFLSSGERFGNDEELKTSVTCWFHSQAAEFYDRGIQKLIPRYDRCLNSDGGYVEK
ncbi:hypothetical protein ANN_18764 [Periplaneta americana]|uniref:Mos1 transposase HTH domain-containing protein n=1 Tax=Periplaneta americana TaxID=6978 RepID=A0ABQ8SPN8_PERAM|nr:hypothetical protein ANN_18764 [Periplaneta americana]